MGRDKNQLRGNKLPPFVAVPYDVLNSSAFRDLPHAARSALPHFMGKPKQPFNKPEYFSTDFSFSYLEAVRYGFAKATFHRVIEHLIRNGFIDPVDKGGLRGMCKSSSRFRLSKRWREFGTKNFIAKEWGEFKPKGAE